MQSNLKLIGDDKVRNLLKGLDNKLNKKIIEGTFRKAARPLVRRAKSMAPVGQTGNLRKSIGVFVSRSSDRRSNLKAGLWVGPRTRGKYQGYHAHFIEFGTAQRQGPPNQKVIFKNRGVTVVIKKRDRGRMKPNPFMVPAYNQTRGEVQQGIFDNIEKIFLREIKKAK